MSVNATIFARINVKLATNSQLLGTQICLDSRKTYDIDKNNISIN